MNELLKVPDSAIIKDLIKTLKSKNVEIGEFKSLVQEKKTT